MHRSRTACAPLALTLGLVVGLFASTAGAKPRFVGDKGRGRTFTAPVILKPNVRLWTRVYGEYDSWTEIYYDTKNLDILLGTLDLRPFGNDRARKVKAVEKERSRLKQALLRLASGKRTGLTALEARLLKLYAGRPPAKRLSALRTAHKNVGAHAGLRDRFVVGLKRLALYKPYVEEVLRRHEMPAALTALAMTESLFNLRAMSKAGAYGCWQFLKGTGKEYLHINPLIDERRDPIISTDGAARMLMGNIRRLKEWPLALTGYNYGPNGMARAAKETGSFDLAVILKRWKAKRFKFASRNYYASFLAALHVMRNHSKYFPKIAFPKPVRFDTIAVPASAPLRGVALQCGTNTKVLSELNPGLTPAAMASSVRLPQGFPLRVPAGKAQRCTGRFHKVAGARRRGPTKPRLHRVRAGESLIGIAGRYGATLSQVLALNGLKIPRNLRVGEKLKVPGRGRGHGFTVVPVSGPKVAKAPKAESDAEDETATQ